MYKILKRLFKKKDGYKPRVGDTLYGKVVYEDKFGYYNVLGKIEPIFVKTVDDFGIINIKIYDKERLMYSRFVDKKCKKIINAKMLLAEKKQKWEI